MFGSFLVGTTGWGGWRPTLPRPDSMPSCQVLLTLDDDLDTVQRDKIYVF